MTFFTDISNIQRIQSFTGGNDTQRTHLNTLVDAVNTIIDAAKAAIGADNLIPLLDGMELRLSYSEENGEVVTYKIIAQKIADIA